MSQLGLLQDESLSQLVRKRLNTMPGFNTLTPELMPVIVLEGPQPDHDFLKGVKRCGGRGAVTAVAAQNSQACVTNPVGSNIIATIKRVYLEPNTAGSATVILNRLEETGLSAVNMTWAPLDMRFSNAAGSIGVPTCRVRAGARAGAVGAFHLPFRRAFPTTGLELELGVVLPPGSTCLVMLETVNIAINNFFFEWSERPRNPSELE